MAADQCHELEPVEYIRDGPQVEVAAQRNRSSHATWDTVQ
jgi:hypothetical protein